jgi:predicted metal-dependent enzyme (double-stranded beta helix superfamily)
MKNLARFRQFIAGFTQLVEAQAADEAAIFASGEKLLGALVAQDDWLPDECSVPHPQYYQQYLLYCDPFERFSVVSFVWGPGQKTPVHDHCVWGMIGMLRGAELCRRFTLGAPGQPMRAEESCTLSPGMVDRVSPTVGDVHEVANALPDRPSISIHIYGANIGAISRHVFDAATGAVKPFVSGYSSPSLPNIWDRSAEVRATLHP